MEYVDTSLTPLSTEKTEEFILFNNYLANKSADKKIILLYRGEKQGNIKTRIFKNESEFEKEKLFNRIFFFGEKARSFWVCRSTNTKNVLKDINDCSIETLEFIFNKISKVVKNIEMHSNLLERTSENFRSYFTDKSNIKNFVERIDGIGKEKNKIEIRDYYLQWLHTAGRDIDGIVDETRLVSTSTEKSEAMKFSEETSEEGLIFHYFISKPFVNHAVVPYSELYKKISDYGLPSYGKVLFPSEEEVSVRGGLLPNRIIGIELLSEKKFIVNPHFKIFSNDDFEIISKRGFYINQEGFYEYIKNTGYNSFVEIFTDGSAVEKSIVQ